MRAIPLATLSPPDTYYYGDVTLTPAEWLTKHFRKTDTGWVVFKTFGAFYDPPTNWVIEPGSKITANVDPDPCHDCGPGIHAAPLWWVCSEAACPAYPDSDEANPLDVWECLLPFASIGDVVVPHDTEGKFRCGELLLTRIVGFTQRSDEALILHDGIDPDDLKPPCLLTPGDNPYLKLPLED